MQLEEFTVEGFRSLERVGPIKLSKPTVLIGHNDAGKSACLAALQFLLGILVPTGEDLTLIGAEVEDGFEQGRVSECIVIGSFRLSEREQIDLQLPASVAIRRRFRADGSASLEIRKTVSIREELRDIESRKLGELKDLAAQLGLDANGDSRIRETYLGPLRDYIEVTPTEEAWVNAGREVSSHLPTVLYFASTSQPDPEAQIRAALQAKYDVLLRDDDVVGKLDEVEQTVTDNLVKAAEALCLHIQKRCPDLLDVVAEPSVSFRGGFSGVALRTARTRDEPVDLSRAGAGRLQRITLAVWEWTSSLVEDLADAEGPSEGDDLLVIYDEPDTHLDYAKQREFLDLVNSQCERNNVQMIVATHSLNLVDRVNLNQIVSLALDGSRTIVETLIDDSHDGINAFISDVTASLGLSNSTLLNEQCFLVVEGVTEQFCVPVLFRKYSGRPLQSEGIALMTCGGNTGAMPVAKFLIDHGRRVFFLLDQDSTTQASTRKLFSMDRLRAAGIPLTNVFYVGNPNELEEIFPDSEWAAVANGKWVRTDGRSWESGDFDQLRDGGKFSDKLLAELKTNSETGPQSKEEMMFILASELDGRGAVPTVLAEAFDGILSGARG